jgi:hypothetical protein
MDAEWKLLLPEKCVEHILDNLENGRAHQPARNAQVGLNHR